MQAKECAGEKLAEIATYIRSCEHQTNQRCKKQQQHEDGSSAESGASGYKHYVFLLKTSSTVKICYFDGYLQTKTVRFVNFR